MHVSGQTGDLGTVKLDAAIRDTAFTKPITSSRAWLEVGDVMSKNLATITPDQTVISASVIMSERHISCAVVVEKEQVVGILTETDLLKKIVVEGTSFYGKPVAAVMTKSVESVSDRLSVLEASRIMRSRGIKRLPVVADDRLVGIVTQTDLTRALSHYGTWRDVCEIMSSELCQIPQEASVAEAAKAMAAKNVSSIIVTHEGEPVGILTQRDLLSKILAKRRDPEHTRTQEAMTSPVLSVPPTYSVFSASRTMEELKIRRLVVLEGKTLYGIVTQTDIFTAIKDKLLAEEEMNLRLLEQSPSSTFTTDQEGTLTYVNPAFARLFEVEDSQSLINQPFLADPFWVDAGQRKRFMEAYHLGNFESAELSLRTAKGTARYVSVFSTFTTDAHGAINGRQGVVHDLTERREAEHHKDELIGHLKRSNRELENFAYVISHDMKTPLRGMVTLTDWLQSDYQDKLDDQGAEKLELLRRRASRIYDMVDGMLNYCRLDGGKKGWKTVDLDRQVRKLIDMIEIPSHIKVVIEGNLPTLLAIPHQIDQIFQNLLSNAIKFMDKPSGLIRIGCSEEETHWKIYLSDNGPGIKEAHFDKIFKMFQTLTARDKSESTGIGLALVKKSVEVHGGSVWIESDLGEGATFSFTLPKEGERLTSHTLEALAVS